MTLPTSGQISMKDILDEKTGHPAIPQAAENLSLRGLSSDSYNDFNYVGGATANIPFETYQPPTYSVPTDPKLSEFHGLHGFTLGRFYNESTSLVGTVPNSYFTNTENNSNGNAQSTTTFNINFATSLTTFTYGGTTFTYYQDTLNLFDHSSSGPASSSATTSIGGLWNSKRTECEKIEARWRLEDVTISLTGDAGGSDGVYARIHPGGSYSNQEEFVTSGSLSSGDWTGAWKTITPTILGGSGGNICYNSIGAHCESIDEGEQGEVILDGGTVGYAALEIRINGQNNQIHSYRSVAGVLYLEADAYESPGFTCIMPDMKVHKEGSGLIRIGDIVVGDRILARGDLEDTTVADQYVEVTEARTHNRAGYWDLDGLHITNDHPVYLTDDSTGVSHWSPVESMLQAEAEDGTTLKEHIGASYQEENVDPVYLGTNPGWYYVYHTDTTVKSTVSGDYAPTSG
jgi:hypothetical protein